jgi:hypothetical protein
MSCDNKINEKTYFSGKILKKTNDKISLIKNENIIKETSISNKGDFYMKLDSIKDGLYNFKHLPEFQYILFQKGDSLVMRLNAVDFDESLVFTGKGSSKNNYLIDVFLNHENEESFINSKLRKSPSIFKNTIDSLYNLKTLKFNNFKKNKKINKTIDLIIENSIKLPLYSKIETYISVLKRNNKLDNISKDFYDFRNNIDLNIKELSNFKPYLDYIILRTNNESGSNFDSYSNLDLQFNLNRIKFIDRTIKNNLIKSKALRYVAFEYLLRENILIDIDTFLNTFLKISNNTNINLEITQLYENIISLQKGKYLPKIDLTNINGKTNHATDFLSNKPVIFVFWSYELNSHKNNLFNKIFKFLKTNKSYNFHCININSNKIKWKESMKVITANKNVIHFIVNDFNSMSKKMILNNLNKIVVTDYQGKINLISIINELKKIN